MVAGVAFHGQIPRPTNKVAGYGHNTMMHRVGKAAEYAGTAYGAYSTLRTAWSTPLPPLPAVVRDGGRALHLPLLTQACC